MNEQIKQIAERLAGLRDALEITPEEMAKVCNLTPEQYMKLESGTVDISVSVLHQISQAYGVELTTLMFGDEPKMSSYFITRRRVCRSESRSVHGYRPSGSRRDTDLSELASRTRV